MPIARHSRMSATWLCKYEETGPGEAKILKLWRDDNEVIRPEDEIYRTIESDDGKRIVLKLEVGPSGNTWGSNPDPDQSQIYTVVNPQGVFSYKED